MATEGYHIPNDFVQQTMHLYIAYQMNIVHRRDKQGNALELSVPYGRPKEHIFGYRISRKGESVKVSPIGVKGPPRTVTGKERNQLLDLFRQIDATPHPPENLQGPRNLRTLT